MSILKRRISLSVCELDQLGLRTAEFGRCERESEFFNCNVIFLELSIRKEK